MDFLDTPEKRQRRLVHLPMGRFGEAVELARAALFREYRFFKRDMTMFQRNRQSCATRSWRRRAFFSDPLVCFPSLTLPLAVASDDSSYITVRHWLLQYG